MRKFAALLFALTVLAAGAQPAAADTTASYSVTNYGPVKVYTCNTVQQFGVYGQYGAWGNYIDGCTVTLTCPYTSTSCVARSQTSISTESYLGHRVTQNSRLRVMNSSGSVIWYRDRSCSGTNSCQTSDAVRLYGTQYASVQCNGVRQYSTNNRAYNSCTIQMNYEG